MSLMPIRRRSVSSALAGIVLLVAFALLPGSVCARRHSSAATGLRTVALRQAPPDFAFDSGDGPRRLVEFRGKPVVVNFWATWCEPCAAELDAFARLQQTYGSRVPLLTISAEAPGVARDFLVRHRVEASPIEDPARKIFDLYSVSAIPVTLILGRDGTVAHVSIGQIDWDELRAAVDAADRLPASGDAPAP